jgi:uncharacterized protein (TIGR03083 family)
VSGRGGVEGGGDGGDGGGFGFERRLDAIASQSRRLSDMVAAVDLETRVPSCPEWSVRDLAHHIGEEQWYWGQNVAAKNADERSGGELTGLPDDRDLLAWLGWCTYTLLDALRQAGPDAPCWTWWGEPRTSLAVARHQAQEVAVHRWDAELAAGDVAPLPAALSEDGVPDFVEIMVGPDAASLPGAVTLTATDTGSSWRVGAAAEDGAGAGAGAGASGRSAELRATASDLVLMLYRRLPVPDSDVVGDPLLVASLLSLADTR